MTKRDDRIIGTTTTLSNCKQGTQNIMHAAQMRQSAVAVLYESQPTYQFPTKKMSQRQMTSNVRKLPVTYAAVATPIRSDNA